MRAETKPSTACGIEADLAKAAVGRGTLGLVDAGTHKINAPDMYRDPVVEAYKPGVDVTLHERNLRLTPTQRVEQLQTFVAFLAEVRQAGQKTPSS